MRLPITEEQGNGRCQIYIYLYIERERESHRPLHCAPIEPNQIQKPVTGFCFQSGIGNEIPKNQELKWVCVCFFFLSFHHMWGLDRTLTSELSRHALSSHSSCFLGPSCMDGTSYTFSSSSSTCPLCFRTSLWEKESHKLFKNIFFLKKKEKEKCSSCSLVGSILVDKSSNLSLTYKIGCGLAISHPLLDECR